MAISDPTLRSDFSGFLTPEMSAPIFEKARQMSAVQQLVRQVPLGANGKSIPVTTGRPVANWVAEGAQKPATKGSMTLKTMTPNKLAAIVVNSMEVVRADPGGYISTMRDQLSEAFAVAFDLAALYDLGGDGTGTGPFATHLDQTTKEQDLGVAGAVDGGIYTDLVDAAILLTGDTDANGRHYDLNGWALDPQAEWLIRGQVDLNGRPIWTDLSANQDSAGVSRNGELLGRRAVMAKGTASPDNSTLGFAGDFSQAAWGVVGGISYGVSEQATVTIDGSLVSLWENNLIAIRAEAEYGWLVADAEAFVQLTYGAS